MKTQLSYQCYFLSFFRRRLIMHMRFVWTLDSGKSINESNIGERMIQTNMQMIISYT